jgi:phosphopantothenoylcysteine decarboxylase/phosphopantothenate--cysteine ligase
MKNSPPHLLLGVTGGVAAYKAAELARLLTKRGVTVQVVMTEAAGHFIGAATFQAITGRPVYTDLWDARVANGMAHIDLGRAADAILVAPATADFLARLAQGRADDLLSTLCLARDCPLLVAPAANRQMWEHPATRRNVAQLVADGVSILGPALGEQACGETGWGRMLEAAELAAELDAFWQPKGLAGVSVLLTAGPTYEPIDPVRGITNRSSGKMGYALAAAALEAGARVTLVSGPTCLAPPSRATTIPVTDAREMLAAVEANVAAADIFIAVAAVADYRVQRASPGKLKKRATDLQLELTPNPDILAEVAARRQPPFCVGFAAETDDIEAHAAAKRRKKKLPLIVANDAAATLGSDSARLILIDESGREVLEPADKTTQARRLIARIAERYHAHHA